MTTPPFLKKVDTVAIVSTARKISEEEIQPALSLLQKWGLTVVLGKSIGASDNQYAGDDALRASDFQTQLDNPKVKAIWCARGGYGTVRIIDLLDFSGFKKSPKWIIGYSDITVFHNHIHNMEIETLHAQMPLDIEKKSLATQQSIFEVLFGNNYSIELSSEESIFNRNGKATGQLVGGNLSMLYSLLGSTSGIGTKGKILFIEDLDEYLYHVDRMMQNLKRNRLLENLAGLIVGGMSDMNDNTIPFGKTAEAIIAETVSVYDYPVCFSFPAGHVQDNRALIMGREVVLRVGEEGGQLVFNSPLEGG